MWLPSPTAQCRKGQALRVLDKTFSNSLLRADSYILLRKTFTQKPCRHYPRHNTILLSFFSFFLLKIYKGKVIGGNPKQSQPAKAKDLQKILYLFKGQSESIVMSELSPYQVRISNF